MKKLLNLFRRNKKTAKYEFIVFSSHEKYMNEKIIGLQGQGWELAGNVELKYFDSPTRAIFVYIPFKRLIYS